MADNLEDGWIKWEGGECPVDPMATVEILYRYERANPDFYVDATLPAKDVEWAHTKSRNQAERDFDVVAYRLVSK